MSTSPIARVRRILSNRYLVGALAVVFVLLLAGILLAGQGEAGATGTPAQAANVGPLPSPTVTTVMSRNTSSPTPVATGRGRVPGAANASGNVTPRVNETVAVVKTLDRYIQNAGGDIGNQLRTPAVPTTPTPPSSVPTSASGPVGDLSWSGEGTYVTEPFALEAGTIQVAMTAGVLTMAQLRDSAGTAIGITTAGPQPATTAIRVAVPGMYRLEIWPFGSGPWTVTISYAPITTAVPTLPPVVVTTAAPTANVTPENSTTAVVTPVPTTLETLTTVTTEIPTETPTVTPVEAPAPMPTQERRSLQGDGSLETGRFTLYQGLASFTSATTANGTFSVTLVGSGETVLVAPVNGPFSGSKLVQVPATGSYLLNVTAGGPWEISIS